METVTAKSSTKEYKAEYMRNYYQNNKERMKLLDYKRRQKPEVKQYRKEMDKLRREKLRILVDNIKLERGCIDCGYNDNALALEFDHVRGVKVKAVASMVTNKDKVETILSEIEKCDVRCSNCHRIKTFERIMGHP